VYSRKWRRQDPQTDIFHDLLEKDRTRPTILFLWDQLFEAEWECERIEEHYLAEIERLKKKIENLETSFLKDSHNSHKPPSTDAFAKPRRTRSLRERSGLKPGGQSGHPGHHLAQEPDPNETRIHPVYECGRCGTRLKTLPLTQYETRQVIDIRDGTKWIVEHRAEMKICPNCDSMNHGGFPPEARAYVCYGPELRRIALYLSCYQLIPHARACEMLTHLYGLTLKPGSVHRFAIEASRELKSWENKAKSQIIGAPVAHFDETGIKYNGDLNWIHAAATSDTTVFVPHEKRGPEAMSSAGILTHFKGWAVHDGWRAYFNYQSEPQPHALCNVHHLRELTFIEETEKRAKWATKMKALLKHTLHHIHRRRAQGLALRPRWIRYMEQRFDKVLRSGYRCYGKSMPRIPRPPSTGPHTKRAQGEKLLNRLHYYREETLAFLKHPGVPFSNNLVERDIRMFKVKQKISGCFRSFGGAKAFCRVRSFLSTAIKRSQNPFHALAEVFPPVTPSGILISSA
jgi:transposase